MKEEIREKLNELAGRNAMKEITFIYWLIDKRNLPPEK